MQPLSSIQVRTEALLLTKLEVWWYLVVKLGPNLSNNFEQVKFTVYIYRLIFGLLQTLYLMYMLPLVN